MEDRIPTRMASTPKQIASVPTQIAGVSLQRASRSQLDAGTHTVQSAVSGSFLTADSIEEITESAWGYTQEPTYFLHQRIDQLLSCIHGEVFVVVIDARVGSPSYQHWQSLQLSNLDPRTIHIPAGVAFGWQVTSESATVRTLYSSAPDRNDQRWLRWNDLLLDLPWPHVPVALGEHRRPSLSLSILDTHQLPTYEATPIDRFSNSDNRRRKRKTRRSIQRLPVDDSQNVVQQKSDSPKPKTVRPMQVRRTERPILLLGCNGQLGRDLHLQLRSLGLVVGGSREPSRCHVIPSPVQVDVTRPASLRQVIQAIKPMLIVNATGLTDVAQGEQAPRQAQAVNANAPQIILEEAERLECGLVHFCSAMVFDGQSELPFTEESAANPVNQVGRTKLIGTQAILNSRIPHLVFRSSWLFGAQDRNYVTEGIDQFSYRNTVSLAQDHRGTPTPTRWLAEVVHEVLTRVPSEDLLEWLEQISGLYHVAPLGYASRVDVGDQLMAMCRALGLPVVTNQIKGAPLKDLYPNLPIPANQQLNCSKFTSTFAIDLPRWQTLLNQQVAGYLGYEDQSNVHVA